MRTLRVAALLVAACLACRTPSEAQRAAPAREPAVAGQFYAGAEPALRLGVKKFLEDAVPKRPGRPVVLVAPHAGYLYSGQVAADAWAQAAGEDVDLIVLLGTNHTVPSFAKVALSPAGSFRTPLGAAEVDREAVAALLAASPDCVEDAGPHAREHSVEVQVPFAQVVFPGAKILPAVVGAPDPALCARFGEALAGVLRGRKALIVASSDLSHYPSAADASAVDRRVLEAVASLDPGRVQAVIGAEMGRGVPGLDTCACGEAPILAALAAARALGANRGAVVSYANSGDAPVGTPDRAVGYGAAVLSAGEPGSDTSALAAPAPPAGDLTAADKRALLAFARENLRRYLVSGTVPLGRGFSPAARVPRGAFVTLKAGGELRGCIGHMAEDRPLDRTVAAMALQAAFGDRRFPPVRLEELPGLTVEVSALTPLRPVKGAAEIVVGRDGVVVEKGGRSAVFLPQVATEQGWGRDEMLQNLCRKAGLPPDAWKEGASFRVFRAEVFGEGEGP